jgi:hypothetical protein
MLHGKPRFRTVGTDLELARAQRLSFVRAARFGVVVAAPRLRLEMVAGWWLERYERRRGAQSDHAAGRRGRYDRADLRAPAGRDQEGNLTKT